jgi:hypothetical protein
MAFCRTWSIVFAVSFGSCSPNQNGYTDESSEISSTGSTRLRLDDHRMVESSCTWDVLRFANSADSILSIAFSDRIQLYPEYDTLLMNGREGRVLPSEPFFSLLDSCSQCLNVRFNEQGRKRGLRLDVWVACYPSERVAEKSFNRIRLLGSKESFKEHSVPGLTYTNDYVALDGRRIFWLNSPCLVSFANHASLSKSLAAIVSISPQARVLGCQCGGVECID